MEREIRRLEYKLKHVSNGIDKIRLEEELRKLKEQQQGKDD